MGQGLDPRESCECVDQSIIDDLYKCDPPVLVDDFDCNRRGEKICPDDPITCPTGTIYDDDACMCMQLIQCKIGCPMGQGLDPRESCECVDQSIIDDLYKCEPELKPFPDYRDYFYPSHGQYRPGPPQRPAHIHRPQWILEEQRPQRPEWTPKEQRPHMPPMNHRPQWIQEEHRPQRPSIEQRPQWIPKEHRPQRPEWTPKEQRP